MIKRLLKNRPLVAAILLLVIATGAWATLRGPAPADDALVATVKKGDFKVVVTTSGELRAPKFVNITGPQNMQAAQVYNGIKIASIVPEGTHVIEGDVVAELDRAPLAAALNDVNLAMQKAEAQKEQASLDSTLNLSKAREETHTAALTLEEKRLAQEQSKFEAPSIQRQTAIDYEKAFRALRQDSTDYKTKEEQAKAKMREVGADLERQRNRFKIVQDVMAGFTIKAPAAGMVIYLRDWSGKKITVGAQVSAWNPSVATLPDLSQMESVTFVNEIDVRKLAVGQPVALSLDSDPTKKLKGVVAAVANVGEQRPNSDAKVFEVKVTVVQPDTTLRPGMTTGNAIETFAVKNALHVPLEALASDSGVPYVFKKSGGRATKQEVETGAVNDEEAVIRRGLEENDQVLLSPPANRDKLRINRLEGSTAGQPAAKGDTGTSKRSVNKVEAAKPQTPPHAKPPTTRRTAPPTTPPTTPPTALPATPITKTPAKPVPRS